MGGFAGPRIITDSRLFSGDPTSLLSYPGTGTTWFDSSGLHNNGSLNSPLAFSNPNFAVVPRSSIKQGIIPTFANEVSYTQQILRGELINQNASPSITWNISIGSSAPSATLNVWANVPQVNVNQYLVGWRNNINYDFYFELLSNGNTQARVTTVSGSYDITTPYTGFGNWTNICFTANSTTSTLYINGVSVGSNTSISGNFGASSTFTVGVPYPMYGQLNHLDVYKRVLNSSEILTNFNAFRGRYGL